MTTMTLEIQKNHEPFLCQDQNIPPSEKEKISAMMGGLVHDFNNILGTIMGFAELILVSEPKTDIQKNEINNFAKMILEAVSAGKSTVEEINSLSKKTEPKKEMLNLSDLLSQSIGMAKGAIPQNIKVVSQLSVNNGFLEGCRSQLQNVFFNLILNARDAMPKGGSVFIKTTLTTAITSKSPDILIISIKDTGMGMPKEIQQRIFERGFSTKEGKGHGQGLANVKSTVQCHGGWIEVHSVPGSGTEFQIYFPILN